MHGLQEIIQINAKQQLQVNGAVANSNLSAKIKANRDRKVEKGLKRTK